MLYSFQGGSDGATPAAGLAMDSAGALYGTTQVGGGAGLGAAYKLSPPASGSTAWRETVLHGFAGGTDGSTPVSPVVVNAAGTVFGTTSQGGAGCPQWTSSGCGTVFAITQ